MHAKLDMACGESDYYFDLGFAPVSGQSCIKSMEDYYLFMVRL
jgi:hypothetical protein